VSLSSFPADTQHLSYTNLAQLRTLPNYFQIRLTLPMSQQLRGLEDFLRALGNDPEKDVDEVVLGWRGQAADSAAFFGLAEGRFRSVPVQEYFRRNHLAWSEYQGLELYPFGGSDDPGNLFFTFISSSLAAFGRIKDLKDLLDVRVGTRLALDSSQEFVYWERELEGSAVQWGVARGQSAVNQAVPWLAAGGKVPGNLSVLASLVQAVLYTADWSNGFSTHLTILCQNDLTAGALASLATALQRGSPPAPASNAGSGMAAFFQGMDIQANGPRLELNASAPLQILDQALQQAHKP